MKRKHAGWLGIFAGGWALAAPVAAPPRVFGPLPKPVPPRPAAMAGATAARPATVRRARPRLRLLAFEVRGLGVMQAGGGSAFTGQLLFLPTYQFHERFGAKFSLGVELLKASAGRGLYPGLGAGALAWWAPIRTTEFGVGGGLELWPGNGGLAPYGAAYASWVFPRPVFRYLERATLAYTHLLSSVSAECLSAGIGFLF